MFFTQTLHPKFADDVANVWSYENSAESRSSAGGTSRASVLKQIEMIREKTSNMRAHKESAVAEGQTSKKQRYTQNIIWN